MKQHRKSIFALTMALALGTIATKTSAAPERTADRIIHAARPVVANNGEVEYRITLDPLYAAKLEIPAKLKGFIRHALTDDQFYVGNEAIEEPTIRYLAYTLADLIHKKPHNIMSWTGTEFHLMAKPKEIQILLGKPGIVSIAETDESEYEAKAVFSQDPEQMANLDALSAPGDSYSGNEIIPWWKKYTNTNDSLTTNNLMQLIDGPIINPVSSDLLFGTISNHDEADWSGTSYWGYWHANHVAGVIGAKANNSLIRGINPNQIIIHYGGNTTENSLANILNLATAQSELTYQWLTINISMNTNPFLSSDNIFSFDRMLGRLMAIASNSNLVVESAGNNNSDACLYAYSFNGSANPSDGIVVVGGHNSTGRPAGDVNVRFNDDGTPGTVGGTNYGPCVDVWAPSVNITSLRYNTNLTQVLSGTSFAAPIAAAIASRYGDKQTRPVERESFLRAYAQSTGFFDTANITPTIPGTIIKSVKWNSGNAGVLKRYQISSAWSLQNTTSISRLYDGSYQSPWAAEGYEGTIVLDLGSTKTVSVIRVTLRSSVVDENSKPDNNNPSVDFTVATTSSPTNAVISGSYYNTTMLKHYDRTPFSIILPTPLTSRYLILNGHNHGSWLAYSEIEVYGY